MTTKKKFDFTYVEFPCTVDLDVFKAYFNLSDVILPKIHGKSLLSPDDDCDGVGGGGSTESVNQNAKSLRHLVLDAIIENWLEYPMFKELPRQEDRNYILSNLDVNLPLPLLSAHIRADFFWRKSYQHRWKTLPHRRPGCTKAWINIYMERHLQDFIETLEVADYEPDRVQKLLDLCGACINHLEINYLQPATDGTGNDHIPLDYILANLPELRILRLTYATRTIGMNFFLGCNMLSQKDVILLAQGLSRCHELENFCLHSNKLQDYQLRFIARSLDKGCHNLTTLSLVHCAIGDKGLRQFIEACSKESFGSLKTLDLTDNKISPEGAYQLSRSFRSLRLQRLVLRSNPIQSDGAAALFAALHYLPIKYMDLSCCWITHSITRMFLQLIVANKTITYMDMSNNELGEEFGKNLYKIIGFNRVLRFMDLRNTEMSLETRLKLKKIIEQNASKEKMEKCLSYTN